MLFSKANNSIETDVLHGILDAQDTEIIIADKDCKLLLMNALAKNHTPGVATTRSCKESFSNAFPELCSLCPNSQNEDFSEPADMEVRHKDGEYYAVRYCSVRPKVGKSATGIFLRNIDDARSTQEKLYSLAFIDQLTGIANRRKLKEDFDSIGEGIIGLKAVGALAIFDMDHFKTVNDTYGHNVGDIMLKRLTSHLESEDAFRGRLYRLGGDEFVLFYAEPYDRFETQMECQNYYQSILKDALRSYTIPNIEASCTLSMGVSFFPWHGHDYSNLLRKADIALYKAKERGRNQICIFEEAFDTAQKLKDVYINIRPVLTRDGETFGYELADQSIGGDDKDGSLNFNDFNRTMEALGLDDIESNTLYFIAYSNQLLNPAVAKNLPSSRFTVEHRLSGQEGLAGNGDAAGEDEDNPSGEGGNETLNLFSELKELAYSLRLTGLNRQNMRPEFLAQAAYCSFDPGEADEGFRREIIAKNPSIRFIATDIDSLSLFEKAKKDGYTLFQGYFFQEQVVVKKTKEIDQLKINYLRLLRLASMDDYVDFMEISSIISSDVALTYKLLRLLNSAAVGLRNPISSIPLAVAYLGEVNLKKWIAMLAVRGVAEDKPMELIRLSMIRAQFGELLCQHLKPKRNPKHVFLTGLLSLLDVALEKSKEEIFAEITVAEEIQNSLLTDHGPYSDLVAFFADYEFAKWEEVASFTRRNKLTDAQVNSAYITAVKWYNDLINTSESAPETAKA